MTGRYPELDVASHLRSLRREGELLASAAARAGLAAPVPACPGWQVRDLLKHTGHVHRWAAAIVAGGITRPRREPGEAEILRSGPADADLPGWFAEGHAALVRALAQAGPALECWTFLDAPSPLAFWARRQAHETAIHRADAEQAAAETGARPFAPAFAADGVDEMLMGFLARNLRRAPWHGSGGVLAIHASDKDSGAADWTVHCQAPGASVKRAADRADCHVTGTAAGLYLALWNRGPDGALTVSGDRPLLAGVRERLRITW